MNGPDVPAAWWIFWLALGVLAFCALIWTFYRLALWADEATWRDFLARHAEEDAGTAAEELQSGTAEQEFPTETADR